MFIFSVRSETIGDNPVVLLRFAKSSAALKDSVALEGPQHTLRWMCRFASKYASAASCHRRVMSCPGSGLVRCSWRSARKASDIRTTSLTYSAGGFLFIISSAMRSAYSSASREWLLLPSPSRVYCRMCSWCIITAPAPPLDLLGSSGSQTKDPSQYTIQLVGV